MVGRLAFPSNPAGEAGRSIGRLSCVSRGGADGLTRVVGCAPFWRLGNRACGCHQAGEGNADCSTHWHCIAPFLPGIPLPRATKNAMPIVLDGRGNAERCRPGLSPTNPGVVGRYSKVRYAKTLLSTFT